MNLSLVNCLALVGFRVDGRSMQLPLGNRHGWANIGGRTQGSPLRFPERRGESCIRPLCLIRPYAQKLRLHRAMLYAFRRSTRNPIRAVIKIIDFIENAPANLTNRNCSDPPLPGTG